MQLTEIDKNSRDFTSADFAQFSVLKSACDSGLAVLLPSFQLVAVSRRVRSRAAQRLRLLQAAKLASASINAAVCQPRASPAQDECKDGTGAQT